MTDNLLLHRLPRAQRRHLTGLLRPVHLETGQWLADGSTLRTPLLFPVAGSVSLLTTIDAHAPLEVAQLGPEGCVGASALLRRGRAPVQALVLEGGDAWSLEDRALARALTLSPALQVTLRHYLAVQMRQWALAVACRRFHPLAPRLARWLLMRLDRNEGPSFAITHELLASLLGVRRVSITVTASDLQRRGLIRYHRGLLEVCERTGLEAAACSCYRLDLTAYREGMGREGRSAS